ncbi:VirB4 family type IV secretion system protein [Thermogemmatispora sp.]|uniref:VirB4 family type IV secretion system protein n=1 Tax=Thermogemmatispora sp. TaxID=1968838 RepID=UPI001D4AC2FA|nr:TraC family protein [Thermogemmatispora sp.]MBX5450167.1 ATP-binding protein [Thermogemmatispora sp.]
MVAIPRKIANRGNVLRLLTLREIRDDVMCLRSLTKQKHQREYMAVVRVEPVNLPLMSDGEQEAILEGFRAFLAGISPQEKPLSIHCRTARYNLQPYLDKLDEVAATQKSDLYKAMAADHKAFVQKLASQRALLQREFYVRVLIQINVKEGVYRRLLPAEVFDQARADLARRTQDVITGLARAGLMARRLNSEELVYYYLSCVYTREEFNLPRSVLYTLDYPARAELPHAYQQGAFSQPPVDALDALEVLGKLPELTQRAEEREAAPSTKKLRRWVWKSSEKIVQEKRRQSKRRDAASADIPDLISLPELIQPASVEQTPNYIKIHHNAGDEYLRARAVIGYPAVAVGGWFDRLLSIDEPYIDFVLFIETVDSVSYVRSLTRAISGYRATQHLELRHGRTEDPYIAAARAETEDLRDKLVQKAELVHAFSLYVCTRAESRQTLKERDAKVTSLLRGLEMHSVPLQYEHLQAWLTCVEARDVLKRARKFDTSTVVAAFPFCSSDLSTEPGALVGLTTGGGLVIIDPTSDELENGHELVFARSGAGKSYYRKIDLMRSLLTGFEAIVIDPDREEYFPICQQFGGSYIRLSPGNLAMNPFDLGRIQGAERNALEEKLQSLLVLFDLLLADQIPGVLSQREKGYLSKIITQAYAEKGITADPATHDKASPDMQRIYDLIMAEGDTFGLADRLLRYLPSFPAKTEVDLDNQLTVFSIQDLPPALQPVGLYLVTEFVWSQARKDRLPVPRMLLIDEAWVLMAFPEGGRFLAGISRRARKYNLHLRLVTQNVEDFLSSESGRTILLNASQKFLMKQDSTTIDAVVNAFKLSDEERKFLLGAGKGEGLFFCRQSHIPLQVVASDLEDQLACTDPKELLRREQARLQERATAASREQKEALAIKRSGNEFNVVLPYIYNPDQEETSNGTEDGVSF